MVRNRIAKNAGVDFYVRDFAALVANGTNAPYVDNSLAYNPGGMRIPGTRDGSFQFQFDQGVGTPEMSIIAGFCLGRELPVGTHIANVSHSINYGFMFNGVVGEGLRVVHENTLIALPGLFSVGGEIYRVERTGSVMRYFANESLVYSATVASSPYPLLPVGVLGFTGNAIVDSILVGGNEYVPREVDPTKNLYFLSVGLSSSGHRGSVATQASTNWQWTFADGTQLSNSANTNSKTISGQLRVVTELRVNEGLSRLTSLTIVAGTALKQGNPLGNPTTLAQLTNLTSLILDGAFIGVAPQPIAPIATYQLSQGFPDRTNRLNFSAYAATLTSLNLSTSRLRLFPEVAPCTLLTSLSLQSNNLYDAGFYQGNQLANKTALVSFSVSASGIPQATINTMLVELATAVRTRSNPATPISSYSLGGTGNGAPSGNTTTLTVDAAAGATSITVASTTGFTVGDLIFLEQRNNNESASLKTISAISGNTITFAASPGLTTAYFILDTPPVTTPPTSPVPTTVYNLANGIGARQYMRRRGHTVSTN